MDGSHRLTNQLFQKLYIVSRPCTKMGDDGEGAEMAAGAKEIDISWSA